MDDQPDDLEWDSVAKVNTLPLSYILYNFIPEFLLKYNSDRSVLISTFVEHIRDCDLGSPVQYFTSGSMAEGLGLSVSLFKKGYSDLDVMMSYDHFINFVVDDRSLDLHPGYVRLIVDESVRKGTVNVNNVTYLLRTVGTFKSMNGPAVTLNSLWGPANTETDFVTCFPCPDWPSQALEWKNRCRPGGWPSEKLVHHVINGGCHAVAVPHPRSNAPHIEWRYSFSKAEVLLAQSLTLTQKHCYIIFKLLVKQATSESNIVKSYHLKTVLYHCCELIPARIWKPSNFALCLFKLLDCLLDFLKDSKIPQYFILKNNLISHVHSDSIWMAVQEVSSIRSRPLDYLIALDHLDIFRFELRKVLVFEQAFKDMIICFAEGTTYKLFFQNLNQTECELAYNYLHTEGRDMFAIECFKNSDTFVNDLASHSLEKCWQKRFISFLEKSVGTLPPSALIACLLMLSRGDFGKVDTGSVKRAIRSKVEQRFNYLTIIRTFHDDHLQRAVHLLFYSAYYLVVGRFETAYITAKTVLEHREIDLKHCLYLDIPLSFEAVISERIDSASGRNKPTIFLNALYLASKAIKKTNYLHTKGHIINTDEQIFHGKDNTFKGVDVLLVGLVYLETDQYIAASKFLCMELYNTLSEPRNVCVLKRTIFVCLLLELLQISTLDVFVHSCDMKQIAKRTLDLICNPLNGVKCFKKIGNEFFELSRMYKNSKMKEFNTRRMGFALTASFNCDQYFLSSTDKALHLSQNWNLDEEHFNHRLFTKIQKGSIKAVGIL